MRGIQNNLANLQINQIAAEQAALQAAKNQQANRTRAEIAEEVLKDQNNKTQKNSTLSSTNPDDKKKSNSQSFKNFLNSKDGNPQANIETTPHETTQSAQITHIDFKV